MNFYLAWNTIPYIVWVVFILIGVWFVHRMANRHLDKKKTRYILLASIVIAVFLIQMPFKYVNEGYSARESFDAPLRDFDKKNINRQEKRQTYEEMLESKLKYEVELSTNPSKNQSN